MLFWILSERNQAYFKSISGPQICFCLIMQLRRAKCRDLNRFLEGGSPEWGFGRPCVMNMKKCVGAQEVCDLLDDVMILAEP